MSNADSLSWFRGRVVPWVTPWSGAPALREPVVIAPNGRRGIGYADEGVHDRTYDGVLLARGRGRRPGQGDGRPLYEQLDPRRQRRATDQLLCQVCGRRPPRSPHGNLWLMATAGELEGSLTTTPPVCPEPCAVLAVEQCPALARGYVAAWVRYPRPWGYQGVLHAPDPADPRTVRRNGESVHLPYGDPRLPWLLADLTVTRLTGCAAVDPATGGAR
ncbi:hypothetical protein [Streptomyces qinzhouensis]|uniref:Uncharacterized protein n=1 Tax=Streptomyces qinzhouensis TaxID=2599401 RepID=A0A5B8JCW7_9ACTN|nr:hypothetical protein [Streptomyces qinzhouensis]QDY75333.1 hypothetical protein FQU76_01145 [Streptomyces qinzhouensis]